jgi:hypothetical protein
MKRIKRKEKPLDWQAGEKPEPYDPKIGLNPRKEGEKKDGVLAIQGRAKGLRS